VSVRVCGCIGRWDELGGGAWKAGSRRRHDDLMLVA
jgi:hypothetical protein